MQGGVKPCCTSAFLAWSLPYVGFILCPHTSSVYTSMKYTAKVSSPSASIYLRALGPLSLGHSMLWTSSLILTTLEHLFPGNLLFSLSELWVVWRHPWLWPLLTLWWWAAPDCSVSHLEIPVSRPQLLRQLLLPIRQKGKILKHCIKLS